jgi:hypothetical protein
MRNAAGLSEHEIANCQTTWAVIGGLRLGELIAEGATRSGSRTVYSETRRRVILGADVKPATGVSPAAAARDRMSIAAVLAHELAHGDRHLKGFSRPFGRPDIDPDSLVDEAETSLEASFNPFLKPTDRRILVEDARDQLDQRLQRPFVSLETDR